MTEPCKGCQGTGKRHVKPKLLKGKVTWKVEKCIFCKGTGRMERTKGNGKKKP